MRRIIPSLLLTVAIGLTLVVGCKEPAQPPRPPIPLSSLTNVYPYGYSLGPATLADPKNFKL